MAQDPASVSKSSSTEKTPVKPFRILTNGRHITVQTNQDILRILAWTTDGKRIVEQTSFNSSPFSFTIPGSQHVVFIMVQLKNGKYYTEKIGVQ